MSDEMETGGLASVGGLKKTRGAAPSPDARCLNCDTPLTGRYCHACGQVNDDFQRPFWKLLSEGATDLFAIDSRIARTIPGLIFRPGRVTRNYIDGKRARYVPPFRLYLLVSVLFFFAFFTVGATDQDIMRLVESGKNTAETVRELEAAQGAEPGLDETPLALEATAPEADPPLEAVAAPGAEPDIVAIPGQENSAFGQKLEANIKDFIEDPRRYWLMVQSWAPRISLFLVPLTVIGLVLAFPLRKGVFLYDHIITALHYQTFLFVASGIVMILPPRAAEFASFIYFLATPLYFWRMICVVYDSSWWMGLLRTVVLWAAGMVAITLLVIAIVTVVLATA